jgi:hypothetical protein
MVMDARQFTKDDYELLKKWWRGHAGSPPVLDFISNTSYIVTIDGVDSGFFSMHPMACAVCYFGMPVVNPTLDRESRKGVIDYMIECAKIWAVKTGHEYVYISTKGSHFLKMLQSAGFEKEGDGYSHLFCKVKEQ